MKDLQKSKSYVMGINIKGQVGTISNKYIGRYIIVVFIGIYDVLYCTYRQGSTTSRLIKSLPAAPPLQALLIKIFLIQLIIQTLLCLFLICGILNTTVENKTLHAKQLLGNSMLALPFWMRATSAARREESVWAVVFLYKRLDGSSNPDTTELIAGAS